MSLDPGELGLADQAQIADQGVGVVTDQWSRNGSPFSRPCQARSGWPSAPLGYLGLSMGSRFGIPLAAQLGDQLNAAVLGKFGLRNSGVLHAGLDNPERLLSAAREVRASTLFHVERHDEVFPLDQQVALFDHLASLDKTLVVRDGQHGTSRTVDETVWLDFLAQHLISGTRRPTHSPTTCL